MPSSLLPSLAQCKQQLYARAVQDTEELALAAQARHGGWPEPEQQADLLDFFALEWVDRTGWTIADRLVAEGVLPKACAGWSADVRTALWVVDGWEGDLVLLRDIATEAEIAVEAPGLQDELPRRTVLKARVIPWGGASVFSGEPDVYEPMGVIARMELRNAWTASGEPELLDRLTALRAAFRRQREERDAWVQHFGADEVVFEHADALADALTRFVHYLSNEHPMPSLGGRTRAVASRELKGDEPKIVQFQLGATLTGPGRHGAIYDEVEGVHFLPAYGELLAHLRGEADHPDVVRAYLDDPGITALPFRRAAATSRLAALLGRPEAPVDELLAGIKDLDRRPAPSVLPGWEE